MSLAPKKSEDGNADSGIPKNEEKSVISVDHEEGTTNVQSPTAITYDTVAGNCL